MSHLDADDAFYDCGTSRFFIYPTPDTVAVLGSEPLPLYATNLSVAKDLQPEAITVLRRYGYIALDRLVTAQDLAEAVVAWRSPRFVCRLDGCWKVVQSFDDCDEIDVEVEVGQWHVETLALYRQRLDVCGVAMLCRMEHVAEFLLDDTDADVPGLLGSDRSFVVRSHHIDRMGDPVTVITMAAVSSEILVEKLALMHLLTAGAAIWEAAASDPKVGAVLHRLSVPEEAA